MTNERQQVERFISQFSGFHQNYFRLLSSYFGDSYQTFKTLFPYFPSDSSSGTHLIPLREDEDVSAYQRTIPYSLTSESVSPFPLFPRKTFKTTLPRTSSLPRTDSPESSKSGIPAAAAACISEDGRRLYSPSPGRDGKGAASAEGAPDPSTSPAARGGRAERGSEGRASSLPEGAAEGSGIYSPNPPSPEEREGRGAHPEYSRQAADGKSGGETGGSLPGEEAAAASAAILLSSGIPLPAGGVILTDGASLFYRERRGSSYYRLPLPLFRAGGSGTDTRLPREERKDFSSSPEDPSASRGASELYPSPEGQPSSPGKNAYSSYLPLPEKGRQAESPVPDRESYIRFCFSLIRCFPTPRTVTYLRSALLSLFSLLEGTVDTDIAESFTRATGLRESDERSDYHRLRNLIKSDAFMITGRERGRKEGSTSQYVLTEKGFNSTMNYFLSNREFFSLLGIEVPLNLLEICAPLYKALKGSRYYKTGARKDGHTCMESFLYANLLMSPAAIDRIAILSLSIEEGAAPEPGANGYRTRASYDATDAYSDVKESVDLTALNNECHDGIPPVAAAVPNRHLRHDICYEVDRSTEPLSLPRQGNVRTSITGKVLSYASRFDAVRSYGDVVFLVCETKEERREREALSRAGKGDRAASMPAPFNAPAAYGAAAAVSGTTAGKEAVRGMTDSLVRSYAKQISDGLSPLPGDMSLSLTGLSANLYGYLAYNEEMIPSPQGEGNVFSLDEMSLPYTEALPAFREYVRTHGKDGGTHGEGDAVGKDALYALLEEEALRYMEPYAALMERYRSDHSGADAGGDAGSLVPDAFMRYALQAAAAEKAEALKRQREHIEGALRAFASEILSCISVPSALQDDAQTEEWASVLPGAAADAGGTAGGASGRTAAAAAVLPGEGAVLRGGRSCIVKGSRAHGMLMALTEQARNADPDAVRTLRSSILRGMTAAAVFPSALSDLYMVCPERWFGRRGILNALSHLGLYCPSGDAPALSYQVPLVYRSGSGRQTQDGPSGGRRAGGPEHFTRLCLWDSSRRIAIENVSNDIGGLIRAREYITGCPAGVCRTTVMVCLINDSLILADGTHLSEGSLVKNTDGTLARFTDVDARKISERDIPASSETTSGTPYSELAYYARRTGHAYTPEGGEAAEGAAAAAEEVREAPAPMERTAALLRNSAVPVNQLNVLPMLNGIARDYVFVTYSQFFSAAAGFDGVPFTMARGASAYLRTGYPPAGVCPSYRAVPDMSPWSDYVIGARKSPR